VIGSVSHSCWKTTAESLTVLACTVVASFCHRSCIMGTAQNMLDAVVLFNYLIVCGMVPGLSPQQSYSNALPSNIEGHKQCHRPQHHEGDQSACGSHWVQLW